MPKLANHLELHTMQIYEYIFDNFTNHLRRAIYYIPRHILIRVCMRLKIINHEKYKHGHERMWLHTLPVGCLAFSYRVTP